MSVSDAAAAGFKALKEASAEYMPALTEEEINWMEPINKYVNKFEAVYVMLPCTRRARLEPEGTTLETPSNADSGYGQICHRMCTVHIPQT